MMRGLLTHAWSLFQGRLPIRLPVARVGLDML
jgi:hypothetical protein